MTKKRISAIVVLVLLVASGVLLYRRADAKQAPSYRFATLQRGNLQSTVSATGALSAVTTVQVGTQVSGQVSAIYADFNAKVKKGELLARIDATLLQQAVQEAAAGMDRAQAQLTLAQGDYDRNKLLFDQKVITASEFGTSQSSYDVARANMKSAQIAVERARKNLGYTNIYAPIDGVIVERNVNVGQTVAASLSAPQLFLIANDLSQMQILASVDESDIGLIKEGLPVEFTVQTYPNEKFTGTVKQVRLQSTTQDNVVNYTAVVQVANPNGKLLPGMTATVRFLTGSAKDALIVPNAALRVRATTAMLTEAGVKGASRGQAIWYVDAKGKLARASVVTGLTDGQSTEIRSEAPAVSEGTKVVLSVSDGSATPAATTTTSNPLQQNRQQGGGGPRPPGGF
jgi:HlyD family secretion protein